MDALTRERGESSPLQEFRKAPPALKPTAVAPPRGRTAVLRQALHGRVFKLMAYCYLGILVAFALALRRDAEALFMVAISGFYLAVYAGVPFMMTRVRHFDAPDKESFAAFLSEPFETWTGVISGRDAMIQILSVPVVLLFGAIAMGLIIGAAS